MSGVACPRCGNELASLCLASMPPIQELRCFPCGFVAQEKSTPTIATPLAPFDAERFDVIAPGAKS